MVAMVMNLLHTVKLISRLITILSILITKNMARPLKLTLISLNRPHDVHLLTGAQRVGIVITKQVTPLLPTLKLCVLIAKQRVRLLKVLRILRVSEPEQTLMLSVVRICILGSEDFLVPGAMRVVVVVVTVVVAIAMLDLLAAGSLQKPQEAVAAGSGVAIGVHVVLLGLLAACQGAVAGGAVVCGVGVFPVVERSV